MTYREHITKYAADAEKATAGYYTAYTDGKLRKTELPGLIAGSIALHRTTAAAIAAVAVSAATGDDPILPEGEDIDDEHRRLTKAAGTCLAAEEAQRQIKLTRLARSEVWSAASDAFGSAMRMSPHVGGWTRGFEGDACELCTWWARDGQTFDINTDMPTHPGCECMQIPVVGIFREWL
jgi:hypothetical protein